MSAQSLVFNFSQRDYIRSAHAGWDAAQFSLQQAKDDAVADVVTTYLALDNAQQRRDAAKEALDHAQSYLAIVHDRVDAGQDAHIEIPKADRTVVGIRQQMLHLNTEISTLSDHLARITGLPGMSPAAVHDSIPALPDPTTLSDLSSARSVTADPGIQSALANAISKRAEARGDSRYLYRPQIAFGAYYSRITTDFTNYAVYYPAFNSTNPRYADLSRNSLSLGVEIKVPLLDQAHRAKARQSAASATRAELDARMAQDTFLEGRLKLSNTAMELTLQAEAAKDDVDIAQDQLDAVLIQVNSGNSPSGTPLTPKDEQNARLAVAQRKLDVLKARQDLEQTEITLLQQTGRLSAWLQTSPPQQPSAGVLR
jgi:outer membrane protein TolC